jgi:hypothetical protein
MIVSITRFYSLTVTIGLEILTLAIRAQIPVEPKYYCIILYIQLFFTFASAYAVYMCVY